MSTVKKRPQLNGDELLRLKWVLGGVLALIAVSALFYLDVQAWGLIAVGYVLVPLAIFRPGLPALVPGVVHRLVFPALTAYVVWDIYAHAEPLPSLVRVVALLLLYRSVTYRKRRDDLQLVVLGLFMIVVAGVLTVSLAFAVQIVAFAACALLFMLLVTLVETGGAGAAPSHRPGDTGGGDWTQIGLGRLAARVRETADWRLFALGGLLFAGLVVVSALLFLAIPRFQLESGFFLDRLLTRKATTGFSDTMKFGDVISIQEDTSVALRVEVEDRKQIPEVPYWRMVVLDEYRDGVFQMSMALKRAAFGPERTAGRIDSDLARRSDSGRWTFYLEPGVSRYLPLTGDFRRLSFTEPQVFRSSRMLKLVALSRDPIAMKAYRVEGMAADVQLSDDVFGDALHAALPADRAATGPLMLQLAVSVADAGRLRAVVREINGGRPLSAEEFARAASLWLAQRHRYSLETQLPPGDGDLLVRWLASERGGHCELFAGSFALLARAAGYPTRVVTGFMGGTWNGDYLIIRNSEAHAWCEIQVGDGRWLRVDPTNDGPRLLAGGGKGGESRAGEVRVNEGGWSSRLDRLRILWYRRIVNFDRGDQFALMRDVKARTEALKGTLRTWGRMVAAAVHEWRARPWDLRRGGAVAGVCLGVGALAWLAWRRGPGWWRLLRKEGRQRSVDPVRREAGHWLRTLQPYEDSPLVAGVRAELLRLRYGRKEGRPEAERVFKEARHAVREVRRTQSHVKA